jgi:hypothetical protein
MALAGALAVVAGSEILCSAAVSQSTHYCMCSVAAAAGSKR